LLIDECQNGLFIAAINKYFTQQVPNQNINKVSYKECNQVFNKT